MIQRPKKAANHKKNFDSQRFFGPFHFSKMMKNIHVLPPTLIPFIRDNSIIHFLQNLSTYFSQKNIKSVACVRNVKMR